MKQTTEQQNTLREPEQGVVDWVGWLRNTTTRVVVQHQFWHGARELVCMKLHCNITNPALEVITLREWNERNHYAPVNAGGIGTLVKDFPRGRAMCEAVLLHCVFDNCFGWGPTLTEAPDAEWFEWETDAGGLTDALSSLLGNGDHDWTHWMLERGIAPHQPFTMRVRKPHYFKDYWSGEGDVDYHNAELVWRAPLSDAAIVCLWAGWLSLSTPAVLMTWEG